MSKHLCYWYNIANNNIFRLKYLWGFLRLECLKYNINPNLPLGIIAIEMSNRNIIYSLIEKILAFIAPTYLLRRNASIGISQLKVSTIRNELKIIESNEIIKKLLNKRSSIKFLVMLISKYCSEIDFSTKCIHSKDFDGKLQQIVCKYTTGSYSNAINPWIRFYYLTLKSLIRKEWISYREKEI